MRARHTLLLVVFALLVSAAFAGPAAAEPPGRYIVEFGSFEGARRAIVDAGGAVELELPSLSAIAATLSEGARNRLVGDARVIGIEVDAPRYPMSQTTPYGISMVQADQLAALTPGNRIVCVIDSGLYGEHEDFAGSAITYVEGNLPANEDGFGHGTHVAGTIAAANNALGVVGTSPGVSLHIVRVFGDHGGWAYSSTLASAVGKCVQSGAHVVNMSLGGSRRSRVEKRAMDDAFDAGLLLIAAAGNDGTTRMSYPASYNSVISVAAVDSTMQRASFSQANRQVDLAAPGVGVVSTVPWVTTNTLTVGEQTFVGGVMDGGAPTSGVTGTLVNGGLCDSGGAWAGMVVLCRRGSITFAEKVENVVAGGGAAAIIYNNVPGDFSGTLGGASTIPAMSMSDANGEAIAAFAGASATAVSLFESLASGYEAWDGTSMATPHVSGVAALIWSFNPMWTNTQIREALESTALDLGRPRRDPEYGAGLVQARAALDYLLMP